LEISQRRFPSGASHRDEITLDRSVSTKKRDPMRATAYLQTQFRVRWKIDHLRLTKQPRDEEQAGRGG